MSTVSESLQGINAYPIPQITLETIITKRGLSGTATATAEVLSSKGFLLASADVLVWLSQAPNVSQGGQSYSISDEQKKTFLATAKGIYRQQGDTGSISLCGISYGYKGTRL